MMEVRNQQVHGGLWGVLVTTMVATTIAQST
jgi:hypothetical protein